jgi:hypothetical protein
LQNLSIEELDWLGIFRRVMIHRVVSCMSGVALVADDRG